jgi:uncharacterized phage protein gp47/JayE
MPWPVPAPGVVTDRAAGVYEGEYARIYLLKNPGAKAPIVDARSPLSTLAVHGRVLDMAVQDLWFYQGRNALELMVDTAEDWLPRHAAIWNVPQILATPAVGNVIFTGVAGTPIPSGLELSIQGGLTYVTTSAETIAVGQTNVTVAVECTSAGSVGSLAASTVLTVVSPVSGLTSQTATVDPNGLTGEDAETIDSWRQRILAAIRDPGSGGNGADFQKWTKNAAPGAIVSATSPGTGFITVIFAMPNGETWRAPTTPEVNTVTAYLNDAQNRKPLGAPVVVVAGATLAPVNFTIHLVNDTTANRTAATNALALQILADATIGGTIYFSRLEAALQNAGGSVAYEMTVPSADVTTAANAIAVMGTVTWV